MSLRSNRAKSIAISDLSGASPGPGSASASGSSSQKKGLFNGLFNRKKRSNSGNSDSNLGLGGGDNNGANDSSENGGGEDRQKLSRRLSMPRLARASLAFRSPSSRRKSINGKSKSAMLSKKRAFEIKHPRYDRREYDHHFVPVTVAVATWNVGGHVVNYSDLAGLKAWLLESIPQLPEDKVNEINTNVNVNANANANGSGGIESMEAGSRASASLGNNFPDLYVLGLQEIVDFNAKNVMLSNEESQNRARQWLDILECMLPRQHKYQLLASKSMVGIFLCVYIKESKQAGVSKVRISQVGTGLLGTGGNKGSVAVSMR